MHLGIVEGDGIEGLFRLIIDNWKLLVITVFMTASASLIYRCYQPDLFESEISLAPSSSNGSDIASIANRLGGLASLAGVTLPKGTTTKKDIAIDLLRNKYFIEKFVEEHGYKVKLFAVNGWDSKTRKLLIDDSKYDKKTKHWMPRKSFFGESITWEPAKWEVHEYFKSNLSIDENIDTGIIKIRFKNMSPELSKDILLELVSEVNYTLKNADILEARENINYLHEQIESTSISQMKEIFYKLIEEQTKVLMLAQVKSDYALKTIAPPVESERPIGPGYVYMFALGGVLGGLFFILGMVLYQATRIPK